jgi:hypothetical protein
MTEACGNVNVSLTAVLERSDVETMRSELVVDRAENDAAHARFAAVDAALRAARCIRRKLTQQDTFTGKLTEACSTPSFPWRAPWCDYPRVLWPDS